jgi:hypothetical protein
MPFTIPNWLFPGPDILVTPSVELFRSALVTSTTNCVCPVPLESLSAVDCISHSTVSLYVLTGHILVLFGGFMYVHYIENRNSAKKPNTDILRHSARLQD